MENEEKLRKVKEKFNLSKKKALEKKIKMQADYIDRLEKWNNYLDSVIKYYETEIKRLKENGNEKN